MELDELFDLARQSAENAYAPYGTYRVGAVIETEGTGEFYTGCNVESAAFNPSTHAEQNAISSAVDDGHQAFTRIVITTLGKQGIPPCGHCRQILVEFCGPDFDIFSETSDGHQHWNLGELQPHAFTKK